VVYVINYTFAPLELNRKSANPPRYDIIAFCATQHSFVKQALKDAGEQGQDGGIVPPTRSKGSNRGRRCLFVTVS